MIFFKNKTLKTNALLFFLGSSVLLSACQSTAPIQQQTAKKDTQKITVKKSTTVRESEPKPLWNEVKKTEEEKVTHPVVTQLLTEALLLRQQGNYSQAIVTAERALTIDSKEAKVYLELARIRLAQGENDWARQLLLKAKRFSQDKHTSAEITRQLNNL